MISMFLHFCSLQHEKQVQGRSRHIFLKINVSTEGEESEEEEEGEEEGSESECESWGPGWVGGFPRLVSILEFTPPA